MSLSKLVCLSVGNDVMKQISLYVLLKVCFSTLLTDRGHCLSFNLLFFVFFNLNNNLCDCCLSCYHIFESSRGLPITCCMRCIVILLSKPRPTVMTGHVLHCAVLHWLK